MLMRMPLDVLLVARLFRCLIVADTARLEQRLVQTLELLMLRVERLEVSIWRRRGGNLGQHDLRIEQRRILIDELAES